MHKFITPKLNLKVYKIHITMKGVVKSFLRGEIKLFGQRMRGKNKG